MALTLNGTTRWPAAKELQQLGETRCGGTPSQVRNILEHIAGALSTNSAEVGADMKEHPEFADARSQPRRDAYSDSILCSQQVRSKEPAVSR
jgi:hypothetical protein